MKYSTAFKAKMVQKMLGGRSANSLAQEVGVNQPTLSKGCVTRVVWVSAREGRVERYLQLVQQVA